VSEIDTDLAGHRDLLGGRYHVGEEIGQGGMGVVHRAWDVQLKRYVAVKLLRDLAMDPVGRARFQAEGETLARLSHPGLITVFDAQTEGDRPYLVMELVDGESLTERCRSRWLELDEVTTLGAELAEALAHVHDHRIVHRDIKPGNVLISREGQVKLADFGVARLLDGFTRHTATGITIGTAAYLSPEQVRSQPLTVASDIYSLGLVLNETISGTPSFAGSWDVVAIARLTTSPWIDERLPAPLRALLTAMTANNPLQRPSAAEVATALRSLPATSPQLPGQPLTDPAVADPPTAPNPPVVPRLPDVPTAAHPLPTSSAGQFSVPARSRRTRVALVAAAVLAPALLLAPRIDWSSDTGSGSAGTNQPGLGPAGSGDAAAGSGTPNPTEQVRHPVRNGQSAPAGERRGPANPNRPATAPEDEPRAVVGPGAKAKAARAEAKAAAKAKAKAAKAARKARPGNNGKGG
jgi:serine/threonine protein kinase